jgi:hypothetical protein
MPPQPQPPHLVHTQSPCLLIEVDQADVGVQGGQLGPLMLLGLGEVRCGVTTTGGSDDREPGGTWMMNTAAT